MASQCFTSPLFPGVSKQRLGPLQASPEGDPLPPFHPYQPLECIVEETEGKLNELGQRISAIEKAQLQSLELIQGELLTKDKIEELKKSREEQVRVRNVNLRGDGGGDTHEALQTHCVHICMYIYIHTHKCS